MASATGQGTGTPFEDSDVFRHTVTTVLAVGASVGAVNMMSLGAFLPVISRDLSVSVPLLGQVSTAILFGSAGVGLLAGPLADQFGKRRLLLIGLSILVASCLGTMVAPSYGWLLAARMISALSGGIIIGTTMATAGTVYSGAARQRALSWIAGGVSAGAIVGIPILTTIASLSSWRGAYAFLGITGLLWVLFIRRSLVDDSPNDPGKIEVGRILNSYHPLLQQRSMLRLYSASFIRAIGWIGTLTYFGAYLGQELGLSTSQIGWAYMVGASGYFLGTKVGGTSFHVIGPRSLYALSTSICGVLIALAIALPLGPVMTVGVIAVGAVGGGTGWVILVTLLSSETTAGQGTTMSLNQAMFALGSASGALLGGVLIALGGYTVFAMGLMGFMSVAAILVWNPATSRVPSESPVAPAD